MSIETISPPEYLHLSDLLPTDLESEAAVDRIAKVQSAIKDDGDNYGSVSGLRKMATFLEEFRPGVIRKTAEMLKPPAQKDEEVVTNTHTLSFSAVPALKTIERLFGETDKFRVHTVGPRLEVEVVEDFEGTIRELAVIALARGREQQFDKP